MRRLPQGLQWEICFHLQIKREDGGGGGGFTAWRLHEDSLLLTDKDFSGSLPPPKNVLHLCPLHCATFLMRRLKVDVRFKDGEQDSCGFPSYRIVTSKKRGSLISFRAPGFNYSWMCIWILYSILVYWNDSFISLCEGIITVRRFHSPFPSTLLSMNIQSTRRRLCVHVLRMSRYAHVQTYTNMQTDMQTHMHTHACRI